MTLQRDVDDATERADLTAQERAILDFEGSWWHVASPKDDQIRDRFGWSTPRYYQQLHGLIDRPEALRAYPVLVKRLLRQRDAARRARSAARLA
jgi:hypothetical protein